MISSNLDQKTARRGTLRFARGFTLIEVILVLAILVTIASLVFPTIDSFVSSRRLLQSIDQVQNDLLKARVQAMESGQAQVFRATINGNGYTIAPWLSGKESENASSGATLMTAGGIVKTEKGGGGAATSTANGATSTSTDTKSLPTDVQFFTVDILVDSRNVLDVQQSTGAAPSTASSAASGSISSPILLYPDGTSTTAQIILADSHGRRMALQIRGVTGRSNVMKLQTVDSSTIPAVIDSGASNSKGAGL